MGEDWKPGDLALCVDAGPAECVCCGRELTGLICPPRGAVRVVIAVGRCDDPDFDVADGDDVVCSAPALVFGEELAGQAQRFRKINPHAPDAEDIETIELLTGKPATVSA